MTERLIARLDTIPEGEAHAVEVAVDPTPEHPFAGLPHRLEGDEP